MVQIEELGKMSTQLALNRNSNDGAHKNLELIQAAYTALRLNRDFLLTTSLDDIRRFLDCEDSCGLYRMDIAAKTLIEESYQLPDPDKKRVLHRAKELLEYIQRNDTTFSLERVALLEEINNY